MISFLVPVDLSFKGGVSFDGEGGERGYCQKP